MIRKLLSVLVLSCSFLLTMAQDFSRGADVSWCTEMEANGRKFYNAKGTEMELMALMKDLGMTAIRLRVWVNPQQYGYGSWSDKADVVAKAKRAHAQGLDLMIDFHYSDIFADPGTQKIPLDWNGQSKQELKASMAAHTKDVLQALKDEGIVPRWVQVGNETNNGMLYPTGQIDWNKSGAARFTQYAELSNAGYEAVKEVFPDAIVIVHLAGAGSARWFFSDFKSAGGKFDMIGLSHYPTEDEWNSTSSAANYSNVNAAKWVEAAAKEFGVPVMICETGFNVGKPSLASQVMRDLFERLQAIPQCAGIFYWEPQVDGWWKPAYYTTLGWNAYDMGAFSTNGRPTMALDAFSGSTTGETDAYPSVLKLYDKSGTKVLTTLTPTGEGVYAGMLNVTEAWLNFFVVDEEHNIWYGTDPTDKTVLSSADNHWNCWIDSSQTGVYDIEVNLVTKKWAHSYNPDATTTVTAVETSSDDAVWYDLQGRLLAHPVPGICIVRKTDGTVSKRWYAPNR